MERAVGGLIELIAKEQKRYASKPKFEQVLEIRKFAPTRTGKPVTSRDRATSFKKSVGYEGWSKSMYEQVWFDSSTERTLANLLDDADEVEVWVRLHIKDLVIRWGGGNYNPDFVAVETGGDRWLIEVKADKEVDTADVQGKREAAQRWANHVSNADGVAEDWHYLLASESDIAQAKGDWNALKKGAGL